MAKLAANRIIALIDGRNYAEGTYDALHDSVDPRVRQFFIFM